MSSYSYKQGADSGRKGAQPSPPNSSPSLVDKMFGATKESSAKASKDYKEGYAAGSSQRVADGLKDKKK